MKRVILTLAAIALLSASALYAQEAEKKKVSTYYRNALTNMMIYHAEDQFGYDVYEIFQDLPPQERYDMHPIGLRVFDNAKEVVLMTYHQNSQTSPTAVIEENKVEILEFADKAKAAMLQLVCGKGHDLSMDDMTVIGTVETLFPQNTDFLWDVEHTDSTDYLLRIDLYVVTR